MSDAELINSRIYREWTSPQGFRDTLMTALMRDQARLSFLGLTRKLDQRRYDESDRELMALVAPHVRRAVTIADLIDHRTVERDRFAEIVGALMTAVLLVDGDGRLVHANRAGETLLRHGQVLSLRQGVLNPVDADHLSAVRRARNGGAASGARTLRLSRRDGSGQATATILPLANGKRRGLASGDAHAAVFFRETEAAPLAAEVIAKLFDLTGAELRVLSGLLEGAPPREIAGRYGLSLTTVKTHLSSLFAKTGTRRQAELIKLVLSSGPIVPTSERPIGKGLTLDDARRLA